jgi:hypothetical protein
MEGGAASLGKLLIVNGAVSRAFIHAYRIMEIIIQNEGHNHWLVDGNPHCNIRRDFVDTKHGIAPRPILEEHEAQKNPYGTM